MAQYTTVVWDEGDEVTSQKLEQMAQNETWLKDNLIIGNVNFIPGSTGVMAGGRSAGIISASKMEVIEVAYDSQIPVVYHDFTVRYPPVFTEPPTVVFCNADFDENTVVRIRSFSGTTSCSFRVWNTAGTSVRKRGQVNMILVGK